MIKGLYKQYMSTLDTTLASYSQNIRIFVWSKSRLEEDLHTNIYWLYMIVHRSSSNLEAELGAKCVSYVGQLLLISWSVSAVTYYQRWARLVVSHVAELQQGVLRSPLYWQTSPQRSRDRAEGDNCRMGPQCQVEMTQRLLQCVTPQFPQLALYIWPIYTVTVTHYAEEHAGLWQERVVPEITGSDQTPDEIISRKWHGL